VQCNIPPTDPAGGHSIGSHGSAKNFGGIDIPRFLAAVLVMVYHNGFWVWAYPDGISAQATGGLPEQPGIGAWVGSGYRRRDLLRHQRFRHCLQPENSTPLRFFEARVKRLAPAVWICAPTTAALLLLIGLSWPTDAVIRLVRTGLFAPYGPWWTASTGRSASKSPSTPSSGSCCGSAVSI
jgi:peptidoglycan/LPS O-acetylase OafA/YrhL